MGGLFIKSMSPTFKIALNPVLKPGEARLMLTRGAQPKDLDIYVLAPASDPAQPSCEVNYKNKKCFAKSVRLDRDDTKGFGPETIFIFKFNKGKY